MSEKKLDKDRIADFVEFLADYYGIKIPDRVVQEYIKYKL
jgi:hypothetical protein